MFRLLPILTLIVSATILQNAYAQFTASIGEVIEIEGTVEISFKDGPWQKAKVKTQIKSGDRLRTGEFSQATVKSSYGAFQRLNEMTTIRFGSVEEEEDDDISLLSGILYFFSRKPVTDKEFATNNVTAAIKGTEFVLMTDPENGDTIHMIDGEVELSTNTATENISSGDIAKANLSGVIETYQGVKFEGPVHWFAYYPSVLVVDELNINVPASSALAQSISLYNQGNITEATALLQTPATNLAAGEATYRAALAISVGQTEKAELLIAQEQTTASTALRQLVSIIQGNTTATFITNTASPSFLLAKSYADQSAGNLEAALAAVRKAKTLITSPNGIALAREAELLFSLGRYEPAKQAAESAVAAAPLLASATATLGFLQSITGDDDTALATFDQAIELEPGYAEAYLGKGLMRIRKGNTDAGLNDIETAVALSPLRASYRAYLSRMFMQQKRWNKADSELSLASELDPIDPNIGLISALQHAAQNNTAVALSELRRSIAANNTRSIFRSQTMLAEDLALRSANLAQIYNDADIPTFAIREASSATNTDPGSAAAHQFLAGAYENLQDPSATTLRYQSPFQSERLAYNLLSPARSGLLPLATSPNNYYNLLSQPDSKLNLHIQGIVEYGASTTATYTKTSDRYSVSLGGQWNYLDKYSDGWNFDRRELEAGFKVDLPSSDTLTTIVRTTKRKSTDPEARTTSNETYDESFPSALFGYRRKWNPENETIAYIQFVSHDTNTATTDEEVRTTNPAGDSIIGTLFGDVLSSDSSNAIQAEIQHRYSWENNNLIAGIRAQNGDWETTYKLTDPTTTSSISNETQSSFKRLEAYLYGYFKLSPEVNLVAGANATSFTYPKNAFTLPPADGTKKTSKLLPKIGLTWNTPPSITLRAAYTQSLGGLKLEDGYRLEPTQVAGFLQGYRTLMAEDIDGTHPAVEFDIFGIGASYVSDLNLYFDLELNSRKSSSDRGIGHLTYFTDDGTIAVDSWDSLTNYEETSANLSISQLIAKSTTLSFNYNYTDAQIDSLISTITAAVNRSGNLSTIQLKALHRTKTGLFASADLRYLDQSLEEQARRNGTVTAHSSDSGIEHIQCNLEFGWRSQTGNTRLSLGVKNLFNDDTKIDPITWTPVLYPRRTIFLDANLQF